MFLSCSTSVRFLPYSIEKPRSSPRCASSCTLVPLNLSSPPYSDRRLCAPSPRRARAELGTVIFISAALATVVLKLKGLLVRLPLLMSCIACAAFAAVKGATGIPSRS